MDNKLLIDENGKITMELKLIRNHILNLENSGEIIKQLLLDVGIDINNSKVKDALDGLCHSAFDVAVKIVTDIQAKPEILRPAAAVAGMNDLMKRIGGEVGDLDEMMRQASTPAKKTNREDLN